MDTRHMKFPQDFPRYNSFVEPPPLPKLPPNATPEQKEAFDAECRARCVIKFDRFNDIIEDVATFQEKPYPTVSKDRARPPRHPLPAAPADALNMNKHESHCSICRHPEREAIEEEFIHWFSPRATAADYGIDVRAIYRHAHALDLFAVRNRKVRYVLSHALERAEHAATPTASELNRMVRTFTQVSDEGQWTNLPSHVIVSSSSPVASPPAGADPAGDTIDISEPSEASRSQAPARRFFSTRRAEKTSAHLVENTHRRTSFLDTQKRSKKRAKNRRSQSRRAAIR